MAEGEGPAATGFGRRGGRQMEIQDEGTPERDLIARVIGGDERAFERILLDHIQEVWRLAFHMLQDHHEAEEVVQDTFVKARRALHGFRGDCPFRSYLLSICRNRCRDELERRKRKRANEVSWDAPVALSGRDVDLEEEHQGTSLDNIASTPDPQAQWTMRLDLAAALAMLPMDEREAFVLITVMQKTAEEAAAILASPRSTVQSRLGRARTKLAACLEEYQ